MHTHPIHLHPVEFDVIGRGPDRTADPAPNERVGKDTVRVNPDETVRILVKSGDFAGQFPFHCHILEHEDHEMMRPLGVVRGNSEKRDRTPPTTATDDSLRRIHGGSRATPELGGRPSGRHRRGRHPPVPVIHRTTYRSECTGSRSPPE